MSRQRVGRAEYVFTYRLTLNNDGPSLDKVNVWISCDSPGTTMLDSVAEFGDIDADSVSISTGTFSLRQDRRIPFDPECLRYEIGFETPLIVSGAATDLPLAGAIITGTVIHPHSGRPIIESGRPTVEEFTTTADANGNFVLEMEVVTQEDFVVLEAEGVGELDGAALTNTLGSVGALHDAGDDGSILINPDNFGSDITHITTALAVLAEIANGGPITTDGQLAAALAQVVGTELLEMAALIKTVIDNPNVPLPPGVNDTLEMVSDPLIFTDYLQEVKTKFPDEFNTAILETAENIVSDYDPAEVPGALFSAQRDEQPLTGPAFDARPTFVFDFDDSGGGSVVLFNGSSDIDWVIDADGDIDVDVLNPPELVNVFTCAVAGVPNNLCRFVTTVEQIEIIRLAQGVSSDQVIILQRRRISYPDEPGRPDDVFDEEPSADTVFLTFGPDAVLPINAAELADRQIATYYYHQDNATTSLLDPDYGIDFLNFNQDGTGNIVRRGFNFTWSVDAAGIAEIVFDNGDSTRYFRYSTDGDISQAVAIGTLANGLTKTRNSEAIEYDGVSEFSEAMLVNRRYRALFSVVDTEVVFDHLFLPGGEGCRIFNADFGEDIRPITWESTPDNNMNLTQFSLLDPTFPALRRNWEAVTVLPGETGDRYWVIEMLDANETDDPNFPFADPAVTPGRLNAYEFIEDLTGKFDPCSTTWATQPAFPSPNAERENLSFAIGDKGYIGLTRGFSLEFWEFDPLSDEWTQLGNHPQIAFQSPSFVIDEFAYVVSGNQVWQYSPATDQWTRKGDIPGASKRAGFGFAVNGRGYIGGGFFNGGALWEYDPGSDTWNQKADHPLLTTVPSNDPTVRSVGGITFVISSKAYVTGTNHLFWEYSPSSDTWTTRAFVSATFGQAFSIGANGYVFNTRGELYQYDVALDQWTLLEPFPGTPVCRPAGFAIAGSIYVGVGGEFTNNSCTLNVVNDWWRYTPH